jgi:hypothetical protein
MPLDVTAEVCFGTNDDEALPLLKCVCGKKFDLWNAIVSVYPDNPWQCDECGRQLYFRNSITVYQVTT